MLAKAKASSATPWPNNQRRPATGNALRPSRVEKSRGTAAPVKNDRAAVGAGSVFVH
jgi:hypothetical protein